MKNKKEFSIGDGYKKKEVVNLSLSREEPKESKSRIDILASRNHWKPDGTFVKEGTKITISESNLNKYINSKNWKVK